MDATFQDRNSFIGSKHPKISSILVPRSPYQSVKETPYRWIELIYDLGAETNGFQFELA
jgi:hypothetical protein